MLSHFTKVVSSFLLSFLLWVLSSLYLQVEISFFVPPLLIVSTYISLESFLFVALAIGLFVDISHGSNCLGIMGLSYVLAALTLNSFKRLLFEESFTTLSIKTYFFGVLSALFTIVEALVFDTQLPSYSLGWILNYSFIVPILDASYALLFFSLPELILSSYYQQARRNTRNRM